jgi:glycopeptide antibiotics resistance protein
MPFFNRILPNSQDNTDNRFKQAWFGLGFFCIWCLFLAAVFWFPYQVQIERKFVEAQLHRFFQVPFHVYYYSDGLTAITAVFQKTFFFIPLGVSLAIAGQPFKKYGINSLLAVISLLFFSGAGLIIELGQALMPNKIPDSTDLLFETIGGVVGYWLTLKIYNRKNSLKPFHVENTQEEKL